MFNFTSESLISFLKNFIITHFDFSIEYQVLPDLI